MLCFRVADDPQIVVANLTVSTATHTHRHKSDRLLFLERCCLCLPVWDKQKEVRSFTSMFAVSVQNADSALQAVPEAAFTQEAPLRQQPQDRGRPPADGEEVAHRQVFISFVVMCFVVAKYFRLSSWAGA